MKIRSSDPDFGLYDVYIGEALFNKGAILEACEKEGYVYYEPKGHPWFDKKLKPRKEWGKVFVVKVR